MAKGSAMGLWRGKKGSSVFYKLTNSNNAQKQGIRERVYEVANPQSNGQATQRAKLLPAQRVAGVLREIVERGWQGVDYGSKSRSEFLKRALSMKSGYPFIEKDDDRVVPGAYQITKGTLTPVACSWNDSFLVNTDIVIVQGATTFTTLGELCQNIIDNNAAFREGDQLTFVLCSSSAQTEAGQLDASYNWNYGSFYLDPTDATEVEDGIVMINGIEIQCDESLINLSDPNDSAIAAVAVIVSRLGDNGQHLRSTAKLLVNDDLLASWFSSAQQRRARESYQTSNAATTNTNWPVDGDAEIEGTYMTSVVLEGLSGNIARFNGSPVAVRARESDDTLVAVYYKLNEAEGENPCVVSPQGEVYTYSVDMEPSALRVNQCPQVSDLQLVLWR